jgi:hypothetical protein
MLAWSVVDCGFISGVMDSMLTMECGRLWVHQWVMDSMLTMECGRLWVQAQVMSNRNLLLLC